MRKKFIIISIITLLAMGGVTLIWPPILWSLIVVGPLIALGIHDMVQKEHTIKRNFPLLGWGRYIMESLRPKVYQYFVESDVDGRPINRIFRSLVYQRAKGDLDTAPFGTQVDVYRIGYEWMAHSLKAINYKRCNPDLRILVGSGQCQQPYSASVLNISAMSFGALSKNAILALNKGAHQGNFAHNTGEGGLSPYHLEGGGDIIWQIGTGYFGCRNQEGQFSSTAFEKNALQEAVKMIEIKLSQGAKPGHGGILPGPKNTPEIARIRGVKPYNTVLSSPTHSAFNTPIGLLEFVAHLRELSGGKPIGFKLCIGRKAEFVAICKAIVKTGIKPDFITVDGGEGGTGAAPMEYANSVGMPLRDGLAFAVDCLRGFGLKEEIRVIASGKILSGFHLLKNMALGADIGNSARGMMLALGCIQALECNRNICPTGITTQNPELVAGLAVEEKAPRVARYHYDTVHSLIELLAAAGLEGLQDLDRSYIYRRVSSSEVRRYNEIFPPVEPGSFLGNDIPERYHQVVKSASAQSF
ncbi:MAG: FMN-binding glutamate synthase family protein [Fidelibacterota bacterium]